jgi:hypothetical protein
MYHHAIIDCFRNAGFRFMQLQITMIKMHYQKNRLVLKIQA